VLLINFFTVNFAISAQNSNRFKNLSNKEYSGIVAIVNEDIITMEDLNSRMNLVLFHAAGGVGNEQRLKLMKEVLNELVEEKLKKQCVKKFEPNGGWVSSNDVHEAFVSIAKRNNMSYDAFCSLLKGKNIKKENLLEQIFVGLSWVEYIRARYHKNTRISNLETAKMVTDMKEKFTKESFLIGRMFFPVTQQSEDKNVLSHVNSIHQMLLRGSNFANIAHQFSKSVESSNGGDLGWVFEGQLSTDETKALKSMSIGSYKVVKTGKGYAILHLRDKREAGHGSYTEVEFTQVALPFNDRNPPQGEVEQYLKYIRDLRKESVNCHQFMKKARESGLMVVSDPVGGIVESMRSDVRKTVEKIAVGGISDPLVTQDGIITICLLRKKTNTVKEPTAEELKMQKINERLSFIAARELLDLRKKADLNINEKYAMPNDYN
jgi:peptidyl-prolyl cis-trans isomerase SurA